MSYKKCIEYLVSFDGGRLNYEFFENIKKKRIYYQKRNDIINANIMRCLETVFEVIEEYNKAFQEIKANNFQNAWFSLDRIETGALAIKKNIEYLIDSRLQKKIDYIMQKVKDFQKFFPYRYFFSREMIEKKAECSICKKAISVRKRCGHILGKLYNGEFCQKIITEIEFLALAIVTKPVDKISFLQLEDKEYDYSNLEILVEFLWNEYTIWNIDVILKLKKEYNGLKRNDVCICDSGLKYKKCCMKTGKDRYEHNKIFIPKGKKNINIEERITYTFKS